MCESCDIRHLNSEVQQRNRVIKDLTEKLATETTISANRRELIFQLRNIVHAPQGSSLCAIVAGLVKKEAEADQERENLLNSIRSVAEAPPGTLVMERLEELIKKEKHLENLLADHNIVRGLANVPQKVSLSDAVQKIHRKNESLETANMALWNDVQTVNLEISWLKDENNRLRRGLTVYTARSDDRQALRAIHCILVNHGVTY
jgi:primosomal protein N'